MASLKNKTVIGVFWSLLQNIGGKGITFIVTIILARLLTPEIFGLIGMLMIFIRLSEILVQAGFNEALIQKKDTDSEHFSSIFWINTSVSIIIYIILYLAAPGIAKFYDQPILIKLTRILSLVFIINAFSYVQEARLQKEMRFRTLTIVHFPSIIIGGLVSVIMALNNFGVWSLIALQIVTRLAYTVQIWLYSKWKPSFNFNINKARGLFIYGSKLMLSRIINTIFVNSYIVIIGKFFPLSLVGYYQNSNKLVRVPATTFTDALNKVTFSAFSSIQHDNKRLRNGYRTVTMQAFFWVCPTFIIIAVLAEPLFGLILGKQWIPSVPFFQLLSIYGILYPLNVLNINILNVKGYPGVYLKITIFKNCIRLIGIFLALPYGIWAILSAEAFTVLLIYLLNGYYGGRLIGYFLKDQIIDIIPIVLISLVSASIAYFVTSVLSFANSIIIVSSGIITGYITYVLLAILFNVDALGKFIETIKHFKNSFLLELNGN